MNLPADSERPVQGHEGWRRRRDLIATAAVAMALLAFALIETPLSRLGESFSPTSSVTFFLLINLNVILLGLLIFLITRNLARLVFERRRRIFGSGLRMRLVVAFLGLTILPAVMLFVVAQGFLTATIDHWFSGRVENALAAAREIAETYYQSVGNDALRHARELGREVLRDDLLAAAARERLDELVRRRREEWKLAAIEVVVGQDSVALAVNEAERESRPRTGASELRGLLIEGKELTRVESTATGDLVRVGTVLRGDGGEILGAVLADAVIPLGLSRGALAAVKSYHEYSQLKVLERPIDSAYTVFFWSLTLVVIFTATWFGFRLAKDITEPIGQLGRGMSEVAAGNLDYRAHVVGDEEIASLMTAFNRMTEDLKASHTALEERHRYIASILENITAAVISIEPGGTVATINPAASALFAVRPEEVRGMSWHEVFSPPALRPLRDMVARLTAGSERTLEGHLTLVTGGKEVTMLVTGTVHGDEGGRLSGIILFLEDVTHFTQVERMEAWREVARRIAHEIKNPLTPVQLSAQRLRKRYAALLRSEEGELLDECTRTIIDQVEQLKSLVNEFSRFARLPAVEVAPNDLNAVAEEALVLFREGHREIEFEFRPDPAVPQLDLDRNAVTRALINMLDNAVAACEGLPPAEARVEVATSYDPRTAVVRLEVADNGSGMAPEVKARAFEPYFSTKKDGSGLGLAIVSAIVADHHAYLRLYDNHPRGTRLVIEFPVRRTALRAAAQG